MCHAITLCQMTILARLMKTIRCLSVMGRPSRSLTSLPLMTQHLALQPGEKVLEVGTGSGYQAAILAEITNQVYTVEIIEPLGQQAASTLEELGYNVHGKIDDGYYGWMEHAPFDAIIVTCAPDHLPQPLIKQLKDGGMLVIPIGPPGFFQTLWLIEKKGEKLHSTNLGDVSFVPLLGEH